MFTSLDGGFTPRIAAPNPAGLDAPIRLHAGDFDGDGRPDLSLLTKSGALWAAPIDGDVIAYARWGTFGTTKLVASFTGDLGHRNEDSGKHAVLRASVSLHHVSPEDIARLRLDPSYFATIYHAYKYRLRSRLGAAFHGLDDRAYAFALATMVAYQAASYRGAGDPEGFFPRPASHMLVDLLATQKLVCHEYGSLAAGLYRIVFPDTEDPGVTIKMFGFWSGPFGNHAQIIFTSGGVSLLCDPTLGLVARTTEKNLFAGIRVPAANIRQLVYRVESTAHMQSAMLSFRIAVYGALVNGLYPRGTITYVKDLMLQTF
jgi:hypothetical protein